MTVLMVTPYAPYRDGIAAYAVQEVRRERAAGNDVEVLSPLPSAAHHHLALGGVRGLLALDRMAIDYERVVLQFSPEMVFGACRSPAQRVMVWAGLAVLARHTRLEIRLHEIEYGPLERNPAERAMAARALRKAERVAVHTQTELDELVARTGLRPDQVSVVDHGTSFVAATSTTQAEARADLGLADNVHVFLAIGFLQEHKGFDRAVDAFGRAGVAPGAELHVVGSVRVDHPDLLAYARRLAARCRATPGATLHQRYVSDSDFDRWIVAADTVVLPYREIWSSGVLERAKLLDRPVIASDIGGLGEQAPAGTVLFTGDDTLVQAFRDRVAATTDDSTDGQHPPGSGNRRAVGQQRAGNGHGRAAGTSDAGTSDEERLGQWRVDPERPDRAQIEAQIRDRVRADQLGSAGRDLAGRGDSGSAPGRDSALDPLLALGPVPRPQAVSARPGVSHVKRLIRRVVNWELDPIANHVEALRRATIEALTALEAERATGDVEGPDKTSGPPTRGKSS